MGARPNALEAYVALAAALMRHGSRTRLPQNAPGRQQGTPAQQNPSTGCRPGGGSTEAHAQSWCWSLVAPVRGRPALGCPLMIRRRKRQRRKRLATLASPHWGLPPPGRCHARRPPLLRVSGGLAALPCKSGPAGTVSSILHVCRSRCDRRGRRHHAAGRAVKCRGFGRR